MPIKTATKDKQQPFINKAEVILSQNEEFQNINNKFTKYLQSQYSIEKLSKKLQNWHELDFAEFIKELNKAIKKENKQRLLQGDSSPCLEPLTKLQEIDWMDVFETKKAEAQTLKTEISKTDREIDQMVYELYGLTEEEIGIVEEATA